MHTHGWTSARVGKGIVLVLVLALAIASMALVWGYGSRVAAQGQAKMESSILSFDGKDFVRTKTTLVTEDGKSAVNTKLSHESPAYKALMQKHSYVGDATIFGHPYEAEYAPLTSDDGKVTGALFVGVAK
jgi:Cache 3/Cache 2 fusion domain